MAQKQRPTRRRPAACSWAVSASYQTLIEPRYRRRYDAITKSKSCTDEETGQHYYPAPRPQHGGGRGGSDSIGMGTSMGINTSMSMSVGPAASIDNDGERQWDGGCSTAADESFGAATTSGSAFDGLVGLGSGVPFHAQSKMRSNSEALDQLNINVDGNADDATQEGDEGRRCQCLLDGSGDAAVWGCGAAFADLELARANSLDGKEDGDGGPPQPAVSTSGSSDAAASPQPHRNGIFGGRRHLLSNRSPTSIGSESDYDVGAEALDALFSRSLDGRQRHHTGRACNCRSSSQGWDDRVESPSGATLFPSDGTQDGGRHYTSDQTDLLFGGPLAPLYRARNFAPFQDAYQLFNRVMGSSVFRTDDVGAGRSTGHTETEHPRHAHRGPGQSASETLVDESGFLTLATLPAKVPPPQTAGAMKTTIVTTGAASFESNSDVGAAESSSVASAHTRKGSAGKMPMEKKLETKHSPKKVVKRTERVVNGRRMIRTETTVTDPKTGKRKTTVEVTKEDIIGGTRGRGGKSYILAYRRRRRGPAAGGSEQRRDDERGVCDRCGTASVAPKGDAAAFELNPMLCGHYRRETPRGEHLASSPRPDPYRLDSSEEESEDEPLIERMSRKFADFLSCGIGCGTPSCLAD